LTPNGQPDYNKFNWDKIANECGNGRNKKITTANRTFAIGGVSFSAAIHPQPCLLKDCSRAGHGDNPSKICFILTSWLLKHKSNIQKECISLHLAVWIPLLKITNSHDTVYKWFNHLSTEGHHVKGYVIIPKSLVCPN